MSEASGMEEKRNVHKTFTGNPEGIKSFRRPRYRWEDIRIGLEEDDEGEWTLINLFQDRNQWRNLVNTVMNHRVQ
jgi:hypothetical protein